MRRNEREAVTKVRGERGVLVQLRFKRTGAQGGDVVRIYGQLCGDLNSRHLDGRR